MRTYWVFDHRISLKQFSEVSMHQNHLEVWLNPTITSNPNTTTSHLLRWLGSSCRASD